MQSMLSSHDSLAASSEPERDAAETLSNLQSNAAMSRPTSSDQSSTFPGYDGNAPLLSMFDNAVVSRTTLYKFRDNSS